MKYLRLVSCFFLMLVSCKKVGENSETIEKTTQVEKTIPIESYLIGTYTDSLSQGIALLSFDVANQELKLNHIIDSLPNPSFVIANKAKSIIATVGEIQGEKGGLITTFSYDKENKTFTKMSTVNTLGNDPCTLAFNPKEDAILVGNYSGGNLSVFPINEKGEVLDTPQTIQHTGNSITKERQEKPHVHSIVLHPTEKLIFVADLGNDTIDMIPFTDEGSFQLVPEKTVSIKTPLGSGPRHILFDKNGKQLYVVFELTNEVGVYQFKENTLVLQEVVPLTDTKTNLGSAAELKLSSDNAFLYVSVRGEENKLVVFTTNEGKHLEKIQSIATGLKPRNFKLSETEDFVLVANQESNTIVVYKRDKKTGLLTKTPSEITINKPVYFCSF